MRECFIYKITNNIDGCCYVGVSRKPYNRLAQHAKAKSRIGEAIRDHGIEAFALTILFVGDEEHCYKVEPTLIRDHAADYNVTHVEPPEPIMMSRSALKLDPPQAPTLTPDSEASPHPGAMIRDELDAAGYSIPGASAAMAVNRPNLNNVILGKAMLTRDLAYRLSALLNPDDQAFNLARILIGIQAAHDWHKDRAMRSTIRAMVKAGRQSVDKRGKKALVEAA